MSKKIMVSLMLSILMIAGCSKQADSIEASNDNAKDAIVSEGSKDEEVGNMETDKAEDTLSEDELVREQLLEMARDLEDAKMVERIEFSNVSVHDPSVVKFEDTYYIFGSHLAAAKSDDLMNWTQISEHVRPDNPLFPNVDEELSEALEWAETDTLWAPDVIQLEDGKFYFYYNACRGDSPLSALGLARADNIEGPYEDLGIFLKSGMWGQESPDGTVYDANRHPNVVDPHTFYDNEGKLWMVYGSYSGGIYILEMDPQTGFPLEGQGYGKKLMGGYHARIEGPYILYSPETEYYYLFLSYGGLDATGGYNIRVARSKNPDGPYLDSKGQDLIDAKGISGQIFYDPAYEPYGHKLMGNSQFKYVKGENNVGGSGYTSPGHNSAYYDEEEDKYYLIFHTRFPMRGEQHEVRVHQFFFNEEGWPVVAPYRYAGESLDVVDRDDVIGTYKYINHGTDISNEMKYSTLIALCEDGSVIGEESEGSWELVGDNELIIELDGVTYKGIFIEQYDETNALETMTFTAGSDTGESIWGSMLYVTQ